MTILHENESVLCMHFEISILSGNYFDYFIDIYHQPVIENLFGSNVMFTLEVIKSK